ncbi:MAG TPA: ABC transporter substrate-binding protein [Myxococcales bacterium]|nr:ABC transporter substrate-binding protein [Myxococcales bacterium]
MKRMLAVAVLLAISCGTSRTVVKDGKNVPYEEAAQPDFAKARAAQDANRNDEAAKLFAQFLKEYPDSELADEARFRQGQSLSRGGKLQDAQKSLQDLLENHPNSAYKKPAAIELGLVQAKLGQPLPLSAQSAINGMSEKEKNAAASSLAQTFAQSGQSGDAMRWSARAVENAPEGPEREARLKDFVASVEAAPAADVAKLVADLDRKSPAWPPAALKLARVQLHIGDRTHASELAGEILGITGADGPYAEGARNVQHEVQSSGQVKPNLVGVVLPLSGDPVLKGFADQVLNAIALTLDLQNRGNLQVEVADSKGDPEAAAHAVETLAQHGVIAILGPLGIQESLAAAARAQQLGVPIVSLSRAEGLTALGDYVFRDMPTASAQAKALAEYAQKKLLVKSFGILHPDSSYGDEMSRYFWDAVDQGGAEVRGYEHYPLRTTTFKPFIQHLVGRSAEDLSERQEYGDEAEKIAKEITDPYRRRKALAQLKSQQAPVVDFDALFIPDSARTVGLLAPAIAAEDVITGGCDAKELDIIKRTTKNEALRTVQLLGTSLWDSADLTDERRGVSRYVQCSIFVDSFYASSERPATKKFVDDYASAYHRAPGFLEAHAFDAAQLLKKAANEGHPATREAMRDALGSLKKPLDGAAGETVFGKDREAQKPFFWLWVNRGQILEFDPEGQPPVPPVGADQSVPGKPPAKK